MLLLLFLLSSSAEVYDRSYYLLQKHHWCSEVYLKRISNHFIPAIMAILRKQWGIPVMAQQKWIWLASMRMQFWSLASLSELRIWCCHELWCMSQNAAWVLYCWLWCKPAAVAPIQPLAWELPNAPKKQKAKNKKQKNKKQKKKKKPKNKNRWEWSEIGKWWGKKWCSGYGKFWQFLKKLNIEVSVWLRNSTLKHIP